jgi:alanyl-tRNA synthetase
MGPEAGPSYEETGFFDTKKRYIEIWNAGVFMQFNKGQDGSLTPLPFTSVDTGSGLERMAIPMNGYKSVYEGEPYKQIIDLLPQTMAEKDKRVIADHTRASIHLIGDDVLPGKNGREYITRRLVRRIETAALRNGIDAPYSAAFDEIIKAEGQNHPYLISSRQSIEAVLAAEARAFKKVLQNGSRALDKAPRGQNDGPVSGKTAFNIVSSYGLPLDTLVELAEQRGLVVDQAEYKTLMEHHKALSRAPQTPK